MMGIDWRAVFVPETSLTEIVLRGTIMYLFLFFALRFFLKRNTGQIGVADLLVIVLLSEMSQTALVGESKSVVEAALAVGVVLFWSYALNWLSFRFPALAHLTSGTPLPLIENGRINRPNLQREFITYDELMAQLRIHGIDEIARVRSAHLEGDGTFSVVPFDDDEVQDTPQKKKAG